MKKGYVKIVALLCATMLLAGCSGGEPEKTQPKEAVTAETTDETLATDDTAEQSDVAASVIESKAKSGSNIQNEPDAASEQTAGALEHYSYADVIKDATNITIIPNGGMNGSTVLYGDKDLEGLFDFIDETVLESGRTINREFACDVLATMLVDKSMSAEFERTELNMMMALALANDFFEIDVHLEKLVIDLDRPTENRYVVTNYGKEDIWIVDYVNHSFYFHDGATEYVSDAFADKHLAVWLTALDMYYDISR